MIFAIVLAYYSLTIFLIFIVGSALYVIWVLLFMKKRREVDFKRFAQQADNQSNLIQIITGMEEIKLNNCEKQKRWEWEKIQSKLFRINIQGLAINQYQQAGAVFFNQMKNVLIIFVAAESVVNGSMSLGMMMAVQFIIGQLNSPIEQMIQFFRSAQDAKISLERLGEIHQNEDEESIDEARVSVVPEKKSISLKDCHFNMKGRTPSWLLKM